MLNRFVSLLAASLIVGGFSQLASAEDVPGHPRINEVDQRLQNQTARTDAGVADGQINAKQEGRDTRLDARVARQESRDEAANGGHITKGEQKHMNKELNKDSTRIRRQRTNATAQ